MKKETKLKKLKSKLDLDCKKITKDLEDFIKKYVVKLKKEGVVLGLSGGIDSAVVAELCKKVIGKKKTKALILHEKDSYRKHKKEALNLAKKIGVKKEVINMTPILRKFGTYRLFDLNKLPFLSKKNKDKIIKKINHVYEKKTGHTIYIDNLLGNKYNKFKHYFNKIEAYYRIKHRLRMIYLYYYGDIEDKLVVGAANKTEYKIGFFVKYGCDDASDIMPLLNLYKTQVIKLAKYLKIPKEVIEKTPIGGNVLDISDEEDIGLSYENIDLILVALDEKWEDKEIAETLSLSQKKVKYVRDLIKKSEHMRKKYSPS